MARDIRLMVRFDAEEFSALEAIRRFEGARDNSEALRRVLHRGAAARGIRIARRPERRGYRQRRGLAA